MADYDGSWSDTSTLLDVSSSKNHAIRVNSAAQHSVSIVPPTFAASAIVAGQSDISAEGMKVSISAPLMAGSSFTVTPTVVGGYGGSPGFVEFSPPSFVFSSSSPTTRTFSLSAVRNGSVEIEYVYSSLISIEPIPLATQQISVISCAAGFGYDEVAQQCVECDANSASTAGSGVCTVCPDGSEPTVDQSECRNCTLARMSRNGAACSLCPNGYRPSDDRSECIACVANTVAVRGDYVCRVCPFGTRAHGNHASCVACPAWQYVINPLQSSTCQECPADYYCDATTESAPVPCDCCPDGGVDFKPDCSLVRTPRLDGRALIRIVAPFVSLTGVLALINAVRVSAMTSSDAHCLVLTEPRFLWFVW